MLTTYSQIVSLVSTFNFDFSSAMNYISYFTDPVANPTNFIFSSTSCLLIFFGADTHQLFYWKIRYAIFVPILKTILILLYRFIFWNFKINQKRISIIKVTIICIILTEQPGVFKDLVNYLSCVKTDPTSDDYLVNGDLLYKCYTPEYEEFKYFYVIPALIFYGFLVPCYFFLVLYNNRD